jgi:hypothetical protein
MKVVGGKEERRLRERLRFAEAYTHLKCHAVNSTNARGDTLVLIIKSAG